MQKSTNMEPVDITLMNTDFTNINSKPIHDRIDYVVAKINFGSMLFGIIGNFICICVLCQKQLLNRKFNFYLLLLAVADLTFCFIVFVNYSIVNSNPNRALYDFSRLTCYLTDYIVSSFDALSVYLTLILSIDRLYAITKPIKIKTFFTNLYPKRVALFGYLLLLTIKAPDLFLNQRLYVIPDVKTNTKQSEKQEMYTVDSNLVISVNETTTDKLKTVDYYYYYKLENYSSMIISDPNDRNYKKTIDQTDDEMSKLPYCYSPHMFDKTLSESSDSSESKIRFIYVVYCNMIVPLLLNIIPALIILILNLFLWFFIRRYTSHIVSVNKGILGNRLSVVTNLQSRTMTKTQKSHYLTIIIMGIWLLITSIPYYSLCTYHWATSLRVLIQNDDRERIQMTIQAVSSAFFNSNHCINIIIYILFHKDFRYNTIKLFINLFNLNPLIKCNPLFFESKINGSIETNENKSFSGEINNRLYVNNSHQSTTTANIINNLSNTNLSRNPSNGNLPTSSNLKIGLKKSDAASLRSIKSNYSITSQIKKKTTLFRKSSDARLNNNEYDNMNVWKYSRQNSFSDLNLHGTLFSNKLFFPNETLVRYFSRPNKRQNTRSSTISTTTSLSKNQISYINGGSVKTNYTYQQRSIASSSTLALRSILVNGNNNEGSIKKKAQLV